VSSRTSILKGRTSTSLVIWLSFCDEPFKFQDTSYVLWAGCNPCPIPALLDCQRFVAFYKITDQNVKTKAKTCLVNFRNMASLHLRTGRASAFPHYWAG